MHKVLEHLKKTDFLDIKILSGSSVYVVSMRDSASAESKVLTCFIHVNLDTKTVNLFINGQSECQSKSYWALFILKTFQ